MQYSKYQPDRDIQGCHFTLPKITENCFEFIIQGLYAFSEMKFHTFSILFPYSRNRFPYFNRVHHDIMHQTLKNGKTIQKRQNLVTLKGKYSINCGMILLIKMLRISNSRLLCSKCYKIVDRKRNCGYSTFILSLKF